MLQSGLLPSRVLPALLLPRRHLFLQAPSWHKSPRRGLGPVLSLLRPGSKGPASLPAMVDGGALQGPGGLGLTKQSELFIGRLAMLGFAVSLLGEALTGQGVLSLLHVETGVPLSQAEPHLLLLLLCAAMGAIGGLGDRGRFVPEEWSITRAENIRAILGLNDHGPLLGLTKDEELLVGRIAQLGFALSLLAELLTGDGILAQLDIRTGVPINELDSSVLFSIFFFVGAAVNPGSGRFEIDDTE